MEQGKDRALIIWLLTGCALVFLMVLIGGITRLTHSGLSMVQWSVTGSFPPVTEARWNELFEQYRQSPEFRLVHPDYVLGDFKRIFWWEFIHRMLGRTIGLVFLLPFIYFLLKKRLSRRLLKRLLLLGVLGGVQGLFGWLMVKSGLNKAPHVSHYMLALHLGTAFTVFGCLLWFALDLVYPSREKTQGVKTPFSLRLQFVLVSLQILYGALVAGLKAGLIFQQYPRMGDGWIPPEAYSMHPSWKNLLENGAGVQLVHRLIALLIVVNTIVIVARFRRQRIVYLLGGATALQFTLGVLTLVNGVPVALASMHQAGAFMLFGATIFLLHRRLHGRDGIQQQGDPRSEREQDEAQPDEVELLKPVGIGDKITAA